MHEILKTFIRVMVLNWKKRKRKNSRSEGGGDPWVTKPHRKESKNVETIDIFPKRKKNCFYTCQFKYFLKNQSL